MVMAGVEYLPDHIMANLSEMCQVPKEWVSDKVVTATKVRFVMKENGKCYNAMEIGRKRCFEMGINGAKDEVVYEIGRRSVKRIASYIVLKDGEWQVFDCLPNESVRGCRKFKMKGKDWWKVPVRKYVAPEEAIREYEKVKEDVPVRMHQRKGETYEQFRQREADSIARMCAGVRFNKRVKDHIEKGEGCIITTKRFENSRLTCVCKSKRR